MNPVEVLFLQFAEILKAGPWSKDARRSMQAAIKSHTLDERKHDILRSKLFSLARQESSNLGTGAVLDWLEVAMQILDSSNSAGAALALGSEAFFSPGTDCLNAILREIKQAKQSLDICVFTISDNRISDQLMHIRRAGVGIRIITDNEKLLDAGSDVFRLYEAGFEIRVDHTEYHMHHKFMLVDRHRLLTGSYNWTRTAAEHNAENILITTEEAVAKRYHQEFEDLWTRCSVFEG